MSESENSIKNSSKNTPNTYKTPINNNKKYD